MLLACLVVVQSSGFCAANSEKKLVQTHTPEPQIRVVVAKDINAALLEAKGAYQVRNGETKEILSSGGAGKRFVVQPISEGLRWGEEYPDVYQVEVVPQALETTMYVNGIQYKGKITVYSNGQGQICIVNEVPIEDFVKSTLASQVEESLSKEALASVVIANRTAAYVRSLQGKENLWDIAASEAKYYGYGVTKQRNGLDEAVDNTRFIVLVKENVPVLNIALSKEEAQELAQQGFDAKKILRSVCPGSALKTTVEPRPIVQR